MIQLPSTFNCSAAIGDSVLRKGLLRTVQVSIRNTTIVGSWIFRLHRTEIFAAATSPWFVSERSTHPELTNEIKQQTFSFPKLKNRSCIFNLNPPQVFRCKVTYFSSISNHSFMEDMWLFTNNITCDYNNVNPPHPKKKSIMLIIISTVSYINLRIEKN